MTYLTFHLVFIVPVIIALLALLRGTPHLPLPGRWSGVAVLAAIAFFYTIPWDNYLVASGIWSYGDGRVIEWLVIGYVPIEEYAFFVLQPIMTGCFVHWYCAVRADSLDRLREPLRRGKPAVIGCLCFLLLAVGGWLALELAGARFCYLGLIVVWAAPVLAFQWGYGGATLLRLRPLLVPSVVGPTVYLWIADMIAIEWGIWLIHEATSTGWKLFSLPLEEAVFFLLTNMMVVQGLLLYYQFMARRAAPDAPAGVASGRDLGHGG